MLRLIQHVMLAIAVGVLAYTVTGSNVIISGVNGDFSYELHEADKDRDYEDSYLFNNIMGNGISNIVRLTAIRSQIETNGAYDGTKKIDVTAYVNRGTMLPGDYITAVYSVSDLLKWAQSGFEYQEKDFTNAQSFLSTSTTYTHLLNNTFSGGMNSFLNSQMDDNTSSRTVSGNGTDGSSDGGKHTVLIDRYRTVDGKNIEDLVSSWQEYQDLCRNVEEAASDLNQNYSEYLDYTKYYDYQNTNLRYYITRTIGAKTEIYTNVSQLMGETTGIDIKSEFEKYGKYIYYCPYELAYDTNTMLDEETLRNILNDYEYAYPDQIRIYIGVDTQNYPCKDDFTQGKTVFGKYVPYSNQMMIAGISAAFVYLLILMYLIAREGHVIPAQVMPAKKKGASQKGEDTTSPSILEINGIYMERTDRIYTEILILVCALLIVLLAMMVYYLSGSFDEFTQQVFYPVLIAAVAFLCDIIFSAGFYSFVRRGKAGTLWSSSFLQQLVSGGRKLLLRSMDNGNVIIRTWIPYILFLIVNGLLFMVGVPGIILAVLMDIYVGFMLYRSNLDRQDIVKGIRKIRDGNVNYSYSYQ